MRQERHLKDIHATSSDIDVYPSQRFCVPSLGMAQPPRTLRGRCSSHLFDGNPKLCEPVVLTKKYSFRAHRWKTSRVISRAIQLVFHRQAVSRSATFAVSFDAPLTNRRCSVPSVAGYQLGDATPSILPSIALPCLLYVGVRDNIGNVADVYIKK